MQDSRMIAEVAPPGDCAMPKVSGSRIATPLAPPRPGSTPMITPRITPVNISTRLVSVSATPKPCISDWISSISIQPEKGLDGAFRQRDLEPRLEDQVENHGGRETHGNGFPPGIFPEPAHEERDEQNRSDVDPDQAHQCRIEGGRNEHGQHQLELADLDKGTVPLRADDQSLRGVHEGRDADDQSDVEREVTRLRAVPLLPADAEADAVVHHDRAEQEKERRDRDFGALQAERGPVLRTLSHRPPPPGYF